MSETEMLFQSIARKANANPRHRKLGPDEKRCSGPCRQVKHKRRFTKNAQNKDGLSCWCRECRSTVRKKEYA